MLSVAPAAAQPPAPSDAPADTAEAAPTTAELRVGRVAVVGNLHTDSTRIQRTFELQPGQRYTEEGARRGLRKLFALGLFSDVWLERQQRGGVMDLVLHVTERPRIARIGFAGNQKKQTSDLEKRLILHPGEIYAPTAVQSQVDSLLRWYHAEGYPRTTITAATDTVPGGVNLRFDVNEGEKLRIGHIAFEGARAFPAKKLRKHLKTHTKGLFGGGEVKEEDWPEDQEKLESFYHDNGYRDMRVTAHRLDPSGERGRLTLVITVDEGPRYRLGGVAWNGNTVVPTPDLQKLWRGHPGDVYSASKLDALRSAAFAAYSEQGYLYVGIEPRETVRDSTNVVDVSFQVTEGSPSKVRYVNIVGNKATREKVIRRELDLHEGDRFRRSALVRSQGDLSRLGLFEEVMPDFAPAESSDVDIIFRVKEKQVGTASAGAGYTGETGFTGFLELGHNNVLGNAQALSLHLERGAKRSDYYLSFTEPWFRDTPTLLGFSGFNTSTELDLYTEARRGGSAQIGRPLPWPDYSRGSLTYRLEDVTISQIGTTLTPQDSITLAGIKPGEPVRTSSFELNFARNSTDQAFYPTRGTRLTLNSELAGGAFGGSVNFHKHRVEGRIYLPSVLKNVTTMVRARIGLLDRYADQHLDVPVYERFRLGGGSTVDPLRGYDDYQVVPEKFIRDIVIRRDTTFITSGPDSGQISRITPITEKLRYPGGRYMTLYSFEQQFPIVHPLHGVIFFDAGNTWDLLREVRPFDLKMGAGIGFRMEIPLLGNIGFDYGYGFNRDDGPRAKGHFLLGNVNF